MRETSEEERGKRDLQTRNLRRRPLDELKGTVNERNLGGTLLFANSRGLELALHLVLQPLR